MITDKKNYFVIGTNECLEHQKCEYSYGNGYKSGSKTGYVGNGYYSTNNGYGWGVTMRPSKLTLTVDLGEEHIEVWIDKFFKERWGRLTEKHVAAIKATMPSLALLQEQESMRGTRYFILAEAYAEAWLQNAKYYLVTGINKAGEVDKAIAAAYYKKAAQEEV